MGDHRTKTGLRKRIDFSQIEKLHPYKTFLFFVLLGSTVVFMTITFLYLADLSRHAPLHEVKLPRAFFLSTLLLVFSSYTASRIRPAFRGDSFRRYFLYTGLTLALGALFAGCQVAGWKSLLEQGLALDLQNHFSFFYVISGVHLLHAAAGILLLAVLLGHGVRQSREPVRALLFFSNRFYQTRIELVAVFWHFVDFLWLGLFLVFLFTF
jgi:cytochrome c oxidase subunit 3